MRHHAAEYTIPGASTVQTPRIHTEDNAAANRSGNDVSLWLSGLLIGLYRTLVYFVFCSLLLTILGALAHLWKKP